MNPKFDAEQWTGEMDSGSQDPADSKAPAATENIKQAPHDAERTKGCRVPDLLWEDAERCFRAVIGEIEAAGDMQRKTAWKLQAWHRRLTWVRWLKQLWRYVEDQHTMALARNAEHKRVIATLSALIAEWGVVERKADVDRGVAIARGAAVEANVEYTRAAAFRFCAWKLWHLFPETKRTTDANFAVDPCDGAHHESPTRDKEFSCSSCPSLRAELVALKAERDEAVAKLADGDRNVEKITNALADAELEVCAIHTEAYFVCPECFTESLKAERANGEPLEYWKEKEMNAAHIALDKLGAPKTKMVSRVRAPYGQDEEITLGLSERIALAERAWQPISTCPTDRGKGFVVLLYGEQYGRRIWGYGYYFKGVPGDGEGWIASAFYADPHDMRGSFNPTHWASLLPPPPASSERERK